jgi:hypothetical protein
MDMHTISEAAKMIGQTYSRVWHAYAYGRVPAPLRVGRAFILTDTDIDTLRMYFGGASKDPQRSRPIIQAVSSSQQNRHDVES